MWSVSVCLWALLSWLTSPKCLLAWRRWGRVSPPIVNGARLGGRGAWQKMSLWRCPVPSQGSGWQQTHHLQWRGGVAGGRMWKDWASCSWTAAEPLWSMSRWGNWLSEGMSVLDSAKIENNIHNEGLLVSSMTVWSLNIKLQNHNAHVCVWCSERTLCIWSLYVLAVTMIAPL